MKKRIAAALTDEQLAYLAEHYHDTTNEELAEALGVSIYTIEKRRTRHGWKKDRDFLWKVHHETAVRHNAWDRLNLKETRARAIETRNKIYKAERARIRWGLPQLTKRHFNAEPREKQVQRSYLKRIGYIIDDIKLIAYYTPETRRAIRLEKIKRGEKRGSFKPYYDFKPYDTELQ